ncbi:serine/threonine-protein kinase [Lyngbya confervoides]|uniref:non-specific serine/threonine protein kinase n=1 Tax=Lyngbya confervoides BDU141951 TaxID=1574623 RepID=A0ABD4T4Y9_9CYAN|nr:serine/threonine-protein kinase [Lyngbya confervoides]MCM1983501.1 serine/threonine protein kinase [Lyngbya confervoides BDU141951]
MIGHVLAQRYKVLEPLGQGGMGQTFIAVDLHLPGQPRCAVKRLKLAVQDPEMVAIAKRLFYKEAEILEKLGIHPQIPNLLAYFEEEGQFFLVQELIEGHPLSRELPLGQRWPEVQVQQLMTEILTLLQFIHRHQVIHRDIKPDNLIRRQADGRLVLIDFGAVKQIRDPQISSVLMSQTVGIGTPGYMATEQVNGKPRPSSDLYSAGIIGIQALTGLSPTQLRENPEDGELIWRDQAEVGEGFAQILTQLTRNYFKFRYQSADEALQALAQISAGPPAGYVPPPLTPVPPPLTYPQPRPGESSTGPTLAVSPAHNTVPTPAPPSSRRAAPRRRFPGFPLAIAGGLIVAALAGAVVLVRWPLSPPSPPTVRSTPDLGLQQLRQARTTATQSGDLGAAIRMAEAIPPASEVHGEAQTQLQSWRRDWQSQNETFRQAQVAFEAQQWREARDLALALPQNPYWDERADPIYFQARAELEKQSVPPSGSFPRASCGDTDPVKPFYRVYISGNQALNRAQQDFCRDAYYRSASNRLYFAAFDSLGGAEAFRRQLGSHFSGVQIEEVN